MLQELNHRGARKRRGRARNWKLIWKNNEGELPQCGKGNRLLGSPGSSDSPPKKLDPKRNTPRHIITLPNIKDEERILKAAREKETVYLQRSSHKTTSWFLKRNFTSKKGLERSVWSHERQGPTSKIILSIILSRKAIIDNGRADRVLPRSGQVKGVHHHEALIIMECWRDLSKKKDKKIWTVKMTANSVTNNHT